MLKAIFRTAAYLCGYGHEPKSATPVLSKRRTSGSSAAVLFVHGFSGGAETWNSFISLLEKEQSTSGWDIFSLQYSSDLIFDAPNLWAADPDIETLALELRTILSQLPLSGYRRLALVAHSMGGLVLQKALVDDPALAQRTAYVFLFGTPSAGIVKAAFTRWWKRQLRDMAEGSVFITRLRSEWDKNFSKSLPFQIWAIQGERDEFVGGKSSLRPFPAEFQRVVPGNHLEIVRPSSRDSPAFQLTLQVLGGHRPNRPLVDGARLAVELGEFQQAVNQLLPGAKNLDSAALVTLALALDGLGRTEEALHLLEGRYKKESSEALGVLGGRVKRRWLVQRSAKDFERARELYAEGLKLAEAVRDSDQAYYHSINLAFLELISAPATSRISAAAAGYARRAVAHCVNAEINHWNLATQGEASLVLGNVSEAKAFYRAALNLTQSPRERDSMYTQAVIVAERAGGEQLAREVSDVFGAGVARRGRANLVSLIESETPVFREEE